MICHIYIHRAHTLAFPAIDTFILITRDTKQGETTHRLQEYRYGTNILAKYTVVFEYIYVMVTGQPDSQSSRTGEKTASQIEYIKRIVPIP